ncbi:MAG: ATPase domain-containing protein [Desulfobacterales bacterium]
MKKNVVTTGVPGLDAILGGGLPKGRTYLVEGRPGAGKTTLGLQFLLEGKKVGDRVMVISFIETSEELFDVAGSHGWSLEGVKVVDLFHGVMEKATTVQTLFPPSEIELGEVASAVIEAIKEYRPDRLLLDSVSQLSMLIDSWHHLRGPILKIRNIIHSIGCTALLTSSYIGERSGELETIVHGSISMEAIIPSYGQIRRELIVKKIRGIKFITGYHNYRIRTGGVEIFTWPHVPHYSKHSEWDILSSGIQELDNLLGGGLEAGTACLLTGSTGAGKSTLATFFIQAAAKRGENSVIFCFDERKDTFLRRSNSLGLEIDSFIARGLVDLRQVNVGELSPGEFAQNVREAVDENNSRVVIIDSLSGYMSAMPGENLMMTQLHELLSHLSAAGVLTIMIVTKYGSHFNRILDLDASYIADSILLVRQFEALGRLRRCISVVKKRHGNHEKTIREFKITTGGLVVGPPLDKFTGILTGHPTYIGKYEKLLEKMEMREE